VSADKSARRVTIKLGGGRYAGVFRVPNFAEIVTAYGLEDGNAQKERLFDDCVISQEPKATPVAKRSFGLQIIKLAGDDLSAVEVPLDRLPDDVADALEAKRSALPHKGFACLYLDRSYFLFMEPTPERIESFLALKQKAGTGNGMRYDGELVEDHCFHGDLEEVKRERPLGIQALASKLAAIGGLTLEAELGEA
jgi:hypothetical protein